jgi:glycosyltransferase involved in cell wall biosynthesis
MKNIWIVNDLLTCIPGTKTFWHLLLEIDGTVDKSGTPFNKLAEAIENDVDKPDLIIRNGTFFRRIMRDDCPQIALLQDFYGRDDNQIDVSNNAERIVFNSQHTKKRFEAIDDVFKVDSSIIPIGVNQNVFKPMAQFRPANDIFQRFKRTGIFVGDYNATKNTRLFEEIVKDNTHVDFIYISKSGNRINLPNVRNYPGGVNEQGMVKLYNESDFCIMCSPIETLHLTTVEAALCDVPVIGTNTGWLADYFYPAMGIRIDGNHTVDKFSHAIARVISSNYQPRDWMLKTPFTWDGCKASWESLIKEVLSE